MILATVFVIVTKPEDYYCFNSTAALCRTQDPPNALYRTGLGSGDPIFTTVYTLLIGWLFVLSSAYLPGDSKGFKVGPLVHLLFLTHMSLGMVVSVKFISDRTCPPRYCL